MKKLYIDPECEIVVLQSEDIMSLSNGVLYDNEKAGLADAWIWSY